MLRFVPEHSGHGCSIYWSCVEFKNKLLGSENMLFLATLQGIITSKNLLQRSSGTGTMNHFVCENIQIATSL